MARCVHKGRAIQGTSVDASSARRLLGTIRYFSYILSPWL
ncbi:hypothetical protein AX27061_5510 [Achromobacter xylosoxidans NBRC 15126 = ATCC 27061]|nr:hypothetical protein AX27061_5510 [Achromobacter xylosoxidans NBRC 15126 = ATCC 27061]CCH06772.1 hypothetical protein NH44784_028101 [Achromobacter xylosoxidans NH44784-1996]